MALSDYTDSNRDQLTERQEHFLEALPPFRYKDTGEPFKGTPKTIRFTDPIQYFDAAGRELTPVETPPEPRTGFLIEPKRD